MTRRAHQAIVPLTALAGLFVLASPAATQGPAYPARPGEVVIRFEDGASAAERAAILRDLGATDVKEFRRTATRHARVAAFGVEEAIRRYRGHPRVDFIEPNYIYQASVVPDDPRFPDLWGLENRGQTTGLPGADIRAPLAWEVTTGSHDVLLAIIDTGIDYSHPDLAANVYVNPGEIAGNGLDDDRNGYVDDVRGWDFVNDDNDPFDDEGHGTHVSGIVGAAGNNGIGVVGVNWRVRILPLKFLDATGSGTLDAALRSIEYATAMGARVINASWGGRAPSEAMWLAIHDAWRAGVVFVAAAGNSGSNNDIVPMYPASYYLPNIIAVAATDHFDRLAIWSSYGNNSVHVGAPGENILSTVPGGGYAAFSGTSMATPHVTGGMGLVFARYPWIAGMDARELLLARVDSLPSLRYRVRTGGRLNVLRPMVLPDSILPARVSDLAATDVDGKRLTLHWSATGDDGTFGFASYYEVRYATSPIDESNFASATRVTSAPPSGLVGRPEELRVTGLSFATTYHLALVVRDDYGNASPLSNVVTVRTLDPPDIGLSQALLSADLPAGERATTTLTLSNSGAAELHYAIEVRGPKGAEARGSAAARVHVLAAPAGRGAAADPGPAAAHGLVERAIAAARAADAAPEGRGPPADPGAGPRYVGEHSALRPAIEPRDLRIANLLAAGRRVLLLQSGADVSEIRRLLSAFPDLAAVDELDATSRVPALTELEAYDAVIVVVNLPFGDAAAVGDVLAHYVDGGGVVVPTLASFVAGWEVGGRFQSGGYLPFTRGSGPAGSSALGKAIAGHPLMAGVSAASGDLLGEVGLEPGAELVASWANGVPLVATRGRVVAVNLFVGATGFWTGDVPQLLHNAAGWSSRPYWLASDSTSGIVPRGGQVEVVVTLDAAGLDGGEYHAVLAVTSDDPDESEVGVPAHLRVTGRPDVAVSGDPVALESFRTYTQDGARTTHRLTAAQPPSGPGFIEVLAQGDYGDAGAMSAVFAEGVLLGPIGNSGVACAPARARFALDPAVLEALAADGTVEVEVRNGPYVGVACFPNQHSVWLEYFGAGDRVAFGPTVIGLEGVRALTLRNSGSEVLNVTSVVSDDPTFTPDAGSFAIPPRASRRIGVRFRPDAARLHGGTLVIHCDDPDQPQVEVALTGEGRVPPDVAVTPGEVAEELPVGGVIERTLTIRNDGASDLEFAIRAEGAPADVAGGRTALLVQNVAPWGSSANETVLAESGIAFDVTHVADLGSFDLTRYGKVIVAGDQPTLAYTRLAQHAARIEQYVAGGGVLEFHAAGWGPAAGDAARMPLPGGMRIHSGFAALNEVLDPAHPLMAGVPAPFTGSFASHAYFSAVPAGAARVAADDRGRVNLVVYPFGRGLVIVSAQKLEYGFANREGPGTILRNLIRFGYGRAPKWLSVSPPSGRVAAGAALEVALRFDATGLPGGDHAAVLAVECNDPDETAPRVPVQLRVTGVPDMTVVGPVTVESTHSYTIHGALTRHLLAAEGPVARDGSLEVEAVGDYGLYLETAAVTVEGQRVGEVGRTGADCVPAPGRFTIAAADLERMVADGVVAAEMQNTLSVDPLCPVNRHRVRLTYARPVDALEFGPLFVGQCRSLEVEVENRGTGDLRVERPVIEGTEFEPSPALDFRVKPGERQVVIVTFCPRKPGSASGTLTLRGDDPAGPEARVRLAGEGLIPPGIAASPAALNEALMIGERSERTMRISNTGGTPLDVHVAFVGAAWVSAEPEGGTIQPEDALDIVIRCDAGSVAPGEHRTEMLLHSDVPGAPPLAIPIRLFAADVSARMELEPGTINLARRGNWLTCHLQLAAGADPAAIGVASLRLNHLVPAEVSPTAIGDHDGDGTPGLTVRFDLDAARATLATGEAVRAVVTGVVGGSGKLLGATVARVTGLRPLAANGGTMEERSPAITAAGDGPGPVLEPTLRAAPSPFALASGTSIHFALPAAGLLELGVYNVAGARVRELANGWLPPGRREVRWDGLDGAGTPLGPGLYFLRLRAPGVTLTRRIVLVK